MTSAAHLLATVWKRLGGWWQWRILWLTQSKFMVGVTGVVYDDDGRVLLLRHRFWPEGSWGLPGGYAHSGETLENALRRELHEETGYEIESVRLLQVTSGFKLRIEVAFAARLAGGVRRLDPHEVLDAAFFAPETLPDGLLRTHHRLIALAAVTPAGTAAP